MGKQTLFKEALSKLMTERLMTIPWHHTNCGIDIQREHVWKYNTLFRTISQREDLVNKTYLVAYDTLGFFTHLLLEFTYEVTYHATVNLYEHSSIPKRTWISDIVNLPPKSPELKEKYDYIVAPTYFHSCGPDKARMLLTYLKNLLKPGGSIVISCSIAGGGMSMWYGMFGDVGFGEVSVDTEPTELRTSPGNFFTVSKLGVTK